MGLKEIREEYPEYNDWSDEELSKGLYKKYYTEEQTYDQFTKDIGEPHLSNPHEDRMLSIGVPDKVKTVNFSDAPVGETEYDDLIAHYSEVNGLPYEIVKRQVRAESGFDPSAVSSAGAQGLMQIMPGTARDLGVQNPFDPEESIAGGTSYLSQMLDQWPDMNLALAAYNAGPGVVKAVLEGKRGFKPETINYVKKITGADLNRYDPNKAKHINESEVIRQMDREEQLTVKPGSGKFRGKGATGGWETEEDVWTLANGYEELKESTKKVLRDMSSLANIFGVAKTDIKKIREHENDWFGIQNDWAMMRESQKAEFYSLLEEKEKKHGKLTKDQELELRAAWVLSKNEKRNAVAKAARDNIEEIYGQDPSYVQTPGFFWDVVRLGPQMAIQVLATLAAGPVGGASAMFAMIGGGDYEDRIAQGAPRERAATSSLVDAGLQSLLEQVGIGKTFGIFKAAGVKQAVERLGTAAATELMTETIQNLPQKGTEYWATNPDKDAMDALKYTWENKWEILGEGFKEGLTVLPYILIPGGMKVGRTVYVDRKVDKFTKNKLIEDVQKLKMAPEEKKILIEEIKGADLKETRADKIYTDILKKQAEAIEQPKDSTQEIEQDIKTNEEMLKDKEEEVPPKETIKIEEVPTKQPEINKQIKKYKKIATENKPKKAKEPVKEAEVVSEDEEVDDADLNKHFKFTEGSKDPDGPWPKYTLRNKKNAPDELKDLTIEKDPDENLWYIAGIDERDFMGESRDTGPFKTAAEAVQHIKDGGILTWAEKQEQVDTKKKAPPQKKITDKQKLKAQKLKDKAHTVPKIKEITDVGELQTIIDVYKERGDKLNNLERSRLKAAERRKAELDRLDKQSKEFVKAMSPKAMVEDVFKDVKVDVIPAPTTKAKKAPKTKKKKKLTDAEKKAILDGFRKKYPKEVAVTEDAWVKQEEIDPQQAAAAMDEYVKMLADEAASEKASTESADVTPKNLTTKTIAEPLAKRYRNTNLKLRPQKQKVYNDGVGTVFSRRDIYETSGNELRFATGNDPDKVRNVKWQEGENRALDEIDELERQIANGTWRFQKFFDHVLTRSPELEIVITRAHDTYWRGTAKDRHIGGAARPLFGKTGKSGQTTIRGQRIYLNPESLGNFYYNGDKNAEYVLLHELIHTGLRQTMDYFNTGTDKERHMETFHNQIARLFLQVDDREWTPYKRKALQYRNKDGNDSDKAIWNSLSQREQFAAQKWHTFFVWLNRLQNEPRAKEWEEVLLAAFDNPYIISALYTIESKSDKKTKGPSWWADSMASAWKAPSMRNEFSLGRKIVKMVLSTIFVDKRVDFIMNKEDYRSLQDDIIDLYDEWMGSFNGDFVQYGLAGPGKINDTDSNSLDVRPFKNDKRVPKDAVIMEPAIREKNGNIWWGPMHALIQDYEGNPRMGEEGFVFLNNTGRQTGKFMSRDEAGAIADPKRRIIDPDGQMVSEDMKWINLEHHNNEFASEVFEEATFTSSQIAMAKREAGVPNDTPHRIAKINPDMYLDLTTATKTRRDAIVNSMPDKVSADELAKSGATLLVVGKDGVITGHDGRHRAAVYANAGIKTMPVLIIGNITATDIKAQKFGSKQRDTVWSSEEANDPGDVIPFSEPVMAHKKLYQQYKEGLITYDEYVNKANYEGWKPRPRDPMDKVVKKMPDGSFKVIEGKVAPTVVKKRKALSPEDIALIKSIRKKKYGDSKTTPREHWAKVRNPVKKQAAAARRNLEQEVAFGEQVKGRWLLARPTDGLNSMNERTLEKERNRVQQILSQEILNEAKKRYHTQRLAAIDFYIIQHANKRADEQKKREKERIKKAGNTRLSQLRHYKAEYKRAIRLDFPISDVNHIKSKLIPLMGTEEFYKWSGEEMPVVKKTVTKAEDRKKVVAEKPIEKGKPTVKVLEPWTEEDEQKRKEFTPDQVGTQEARNKYEKVMAGVEDYIARGETLPSTLGENEVDAVTQISMAVQKAKEKKAITEEEYKDALERISIAAFGRDTSVDGDEFASDPMSPRPMQKDLDKWLGKGVAKFDAFASAADGFGVDQWQFTVMDPNSPLFKGSFNLLEWSKEAVQDKIKTMEAEYTRVREMVAKNKKKGRKWEVDLNSKYSLTHYTNFDDETQGVITFNFFTERNTIQIIWTIEDEIGEVVTVERDLNRKRASREDHRKALAIIFHIRTMLEDVFQGKYRMPMPNEIIYEGSRESDIIKHKNYNLFADRIANILGWKVVERGEFGAWVIRDPSFKKKELIDEDIYQDTMEKDMGPQWEHTIDDAEFESDPTPEKHVYGDINTEEKLGVAEVPLRDRSFFSKTWDNFIDAIKQLREFKFLKRKEAPDVKYALRQLKKAKANSARRAVKILETILSDLDPVRYHNFQRLAYLMDLREQVYINDKLRAEGKEDDIKVTANPFGLSDNEIKDETQKVWELVMNDAKTRYAWNVRKVAWNEIRRIYKEAQAAVGFNVANRLHRANYFRHQVLDYMEGEHKRARNAGFRSSPKLAVPTRRSHLRPRGAKTGYAMNLNYLQADFEILAQLMYDTEVALTLDEIMTRHGSKEYKEGYELYKPNEGAVFYMAHTVPEKIMRKALEDGVKTINVPRSKITQALALGGKYSGYYLPKNIADTLNNALVQKPETGFGKLFRITLTSWKAYQLLAPMRILKYNMRNMTGDAEAVFLGSPGVFKYVPRAIKDIYNWKRRGIIDGRLQEWIDRGGQETTLQSQEMFNIFKRPEFRKVTGQKLELRDIPKELWNKTYGLARGITDAREILLRYAAYVKFANEIDANNGRPKQYAASLKEEVNALIDNKDKAFMMSNDLLGAYDRISEAGESLRKYIYPFWSFQEVNMKRTFTMMENIANDDGAMMAVGKWLGVKTPFLAIKAGKFAFKFFLFSLGVQFWNNWMFPDEEDALPEEMRRRSHIILGKTSGGKPEIYYFPRIGVVGDLLEWMGADTAPADVVDLILGKESLKSIVSKYDYGKENLKDVLNKVVQGVGPQFKMPFEMATREKFFPSMWNRQPITDFGKYLADTAVIGPVYDAISGRPTRNDWAKREAIRTGIYYEDKYRLGWLAVQQKLNDYKRRTGLKGRGFIVTESGSALYNMGVAWRYGDQKALTKYLGEYVTATVKKFGKVDITKTMNAEWEKLNPIESLPETHKKLFLMELLSNERDAYAFGLALRYYAEVKSGKQFVKQNGK